MFIYHWAHEQTTINFSMHELGIGSETTIVDWNNYLREVCALKLVEEPLCIGGEGLHVEIDESMFVRRKYNVGRAVRQQWVFGGTCRETGECFLYTVEDRSAKTLLPLIEQSIKRGTTIISDEWRAYLTIKDIPDRDYKHITVNHSENFVDPATGACTNTVESLWGKAKARNKKHWGTHRSMIDSYLSEFIWRRQSVGKDPFLRILEDIVKINPLA
jgi:transposase-like protein